MISSPTHPCASVSGQSPVTWVSNVGMIKVITVSINIMESLPICYNELFVYLLLRSLMYF